MTQDNLETDPATEIGEIYFIYAEIWDEAQRKWDPLRAEIYQKFVEYLESTYGLSREEYEERCRKWEEENPE